jgi:hypothetical protein
VALQVEARLITKEFMPTGFGGNERFRFDVNLRIELFQCLLDLQVAIGDQLLVMR